MTTILTKSMTSNTNTLFDTISCDIMQIIIDKVEHIKKQIKPRNHRSVILSWLYNNQNKGTTLSTNGSNLYSL